MSELACMDCGALYRELGVDLVLPDQVWKVLVPEEKGILCASCICKRCERHGATCLQSWPDKLEYGGIALNATDNEDK